MKARKKQRKPVKDIYHVEMAEKRSESSVSVSDKNESASDKDEKEMTCTINTCDLRVDGDEKNVPGNKFQSITLTRAMKPPKSPKNTIKIEAADPLELMLQPESSSNGNQNFD